MNEQYPEKRCDICHQTLYNGEPCVLNKCRHGYHRRCSVQGGEMNDRECPLCPDENRSLLPMSNRNIDEEDNVSKFFSIWSISQFIHNS